MIPCNDMEYSGQVTHPRSSLVRHNVFVCLFVCFYIGDKIPANTLLICSFNPSFVKFLSTANSVPGDGDTKLNVMVLFVKEPWIRWEDTQVIAYTRIRWCENAEEEISLKISREKKHLSCKERGREIAGIK